MNRFKAIAWTPLATSGIVGLFFLVKLYFPQDLVQFPSGHFAPRFPVGAHTTVVTDSIDLEGYPDYEVAINRKRSLGIDPEKNRIVALLKATGPFAFQRESTRIRFYDWLGVQPLPPRGDYLITLWDFLALGAELNHRERVHLDDECKEICSKLPWKRPDFPRIAAWIERNRKPLSVAMLACQKPQYFFPLTDPFRGEPDGGIRQAGSACESVLESIPCQVTTLWCCRAMLEIGENEQLASAQSLLSCLHWIHAFEPSSIKELTQLLALERQVYSLWGILLENASFSADELEQFANEIESITPFPSVADLVDEFERLAVLEEALFVNKFGKIQSDLQIGYMALKNKIEKSDRFFQVRRNLMRIIHHDHLFQINEWFDQTREDLKITNLRLRRDALNRLSTRLKEKARSAMRALDGEEKAWIPAPFFSRSMTSLAAAHFVSTALTPAILLQNDVDEFEQARELFLVSVALARYKGKNGGYPETLEPLVPHYLAVVPNDRFSGRSLVYSRLKESSYLLYSVGVDGIDSKGKTRQDDPHADDIAIRFPMLMGKQRKITSDFP